MSRGLSTIQKTILALLTGTEKGKVYGNCSGGLLTKELLDELMERGILDDRRPRKHLMFTVVRACRSLVNRKLLTGTHCHDDGSGPQLTISWKYVSPTKTKDC